jgi:hypothetical protein
VIAKVYCRGHYGLEPFSAGVERLHAAIGQGQAHQMVGNQAQRYVGLQQVHGDHGAFQRGSRVADPRVERCLQPLRPGQDTHRPA